MFRSRMNNRMLFELDPLSFIDTDHVATRTLPLIVIMNAIVIYNSFLPAMPQLALANLDVLEYLGFALGTLDGQHRRFLCNNNTAETAAAFCSPLDSATHLYLLGEYDFDRGNVARIAFF